MKWMVGSTNHWTTWRITWQIFVGIYFESFRQKRKPNANPQIRHWRRTYQDIKIRRSQIKRVDVRDEWDWAQDRCPTQILSRTLWRLVQNSWTPALRWYWSWFWSVPGRTPDCLILKLWTTPVDELDIQSTKMTETDQKMSILGVDQVQYLAKMLLTLANLQS